MSPMRPFTKMRDGRYKVRLDPTMRAVLVGLSTQFASVVTSGDPVTTRLFPPAYVGEGQDRFEEAYRELVGAALASHHVQALGTLSRTATAQSVDRPDLEAWCSAVQAMRLVLGTRLSVSEEMPAPDAEDPDAPLFHLYDVLGSLQAEIVHQLAADLPDEGTEEHGWLR